MSGFKDPYLQNKLSEAKRKIFRRHKCRKSKNKKLQKLFTRKSGKYLIWRKYVFKKFGYQCSICGSKERLQAHHIKEWQKYPSERFNVENGVLLCYLCHIKIHPWMGIEEKNKAMDDEYRAIVGI
jgi:predicted restriction endonuclease